MDLNYKNLSNSKYWLNRSINKSHELFNNLKPYEAELKAVYIEAMDSIEQQISKLYSDFSTDERLTHQTVSLNLTQQERYLYQQDLRKIIDRIGLDASEKLIAELDAMTSFNNLTRLTAKLNQIKAILLEMGYKEDLILNNALTNGYIDSYYYTFYMLEVGLGIGIDFTLLNQRAIEQAIKYPWSGSMFSDLIWDNKDLLLKQLRQNIISGIISGKSYKDMAKAMQATMDDKGYKNILRLIRTEFAHIIEEASAEGYSESGIVSQYIIIATLDSKTSKICQQQDQEVYDLDKRIVGTNYPPFHPNCRSTVAPYFEDTVIETRIARNSKGQNYKVDGKMSYKKWKQNKKL